MVFSWQPKLTVLLIHKLMTATPMKKDWKYRDDSPRRNSNLKPKNNLDRHPILRQANIMRREMRQSIVLSANQQETCQYIVLLKAITITPLHEKTRPKQCSNCIAVLYDYFLAPYILRWTLCFAACEIERMPAMAIYLQWLYFGRLFPTMNKTV